MIQQEKLLSLKPDMFPRIMVAAPKSGSGKTTFTCALLELLKQKGKNPVAFKCGPDFIDPMFHKNVLGVHSTNLDSYFSDDEQILKIFKRNCREGHSFNQASGDDAVCAVIEGVMGLFDGLGGTSLKASSYDIAKITKTPILLVIDSQGMSRSIVPLIKGFLDYDKEQGAGENLIKGVFLNKCSKSLFSILKPMIESECGVKVVGFLSKDSEDVWKSRHLGLILPDEIENLRSQIEKTAKKLEETIDFSVLNEIMTGTTTNTPDSSEGETSPYQISDCTIAVAFDEAFCFYYPENIRLLEENGAKIVYFSPLHDKSLPENADGILLGGGYPEIYAAQLEENESMRHSIKNAVEKGVPVIAECGGFMYLHEKLIDSGSFDMCGVIKGECHYTGKLVRFGYAEFTPKKGGCFNKIESIKGHEFHYFDSTNNGSDFTARKPLSQKSWDCMIFTPTMLLGFPHLYYPSNPEIVSWFLSACTKK